jgi:hypothetical protein
MSLTSLATDLRLGRGKSREIEFNVVDVLSDQDIQQPARFPSRKELVRPVGPRCAEAVAEDLAQDGPGLLRVGPDEPSCFKDLLLK